MAKTLACHTEATLDTQSLLVRQYLRSLADQRLGFVGLTRLLEDKSFWKHLTKQIV